MLRFTAYFIKLVVGLKFSEHARAQLKRRKISQIKVISQVVYKPEEILTSFRGRKLRRKTIRGKMLEVVTSTEGSKITVVTAYYLKEENEN